MNKNISTALKLGAFAILPLGTGGCRWIAIGDSILHGSAPELISAMGPGGHVDAEPMRGPNNQGWNYNQTSNEVADALIPLVNVGPDEYGLRWLIIQEDGGNETVESYRAFVAKIVSQTDDEVCIAWVDPNSEYQPERDAAYRAVIDEELARQPCHVAVDTQGLSLKDGLHPDVEGATELVRRIAAATEATASTYAGSG